MKPQSRLALSAIGSRALLVGTSTHGGGSPLPELPFVADTVTRLGRVLVSAGGLDPACQQSLIDPDDPLEFGETLRDVAEQATDVLLLYYTGYALVSPSGELYLATHATQELTTGLAYNAFPYSAIRDVLSGCHAESVVVILDCVVQPSAQPEIISARAAVPRGYVLLSLSENGTEFTAELTRLLTDGAPTAPADITFEDVYQHLARALPAQGGARPVRHTAGATGSLVLARNDAADPDHAPAARDYTGNPYPGLAAFAIDNARFFFGRERVTRELTERVLTTNGIVAVAGPADSGKTSVIRGGLIPALDSGYRIITPGTAESIAIMESEYPERQVLIVDQFEELFTRISDELWREEFVDWLAALRSSGTPVVIAIRSDFLEPCSDMEHPALRQAIENAIFVDPLTVDDLRAAITMPAAAVGVTIEPGLVELLLNEFEHGATPALLAWTLSQIWHRRTDNTLTIEAFRASGGLAYMLAATAEQLYAMLSDEDKQRLRTVMLHLVAVGNEGTILRRQAEREDLPSSDILARLVDHRLVIEDESKVEITHEALFLWPRLRAWIEADRARLVAAQQLRDAALQWAASSHDPAYLHSGTALAASTAAAADAPPLVRDFIAASMREQRRRMRRRRMALTSLVILIVTALVAAAAALVQDQETQELTNRADSRAIAARSEAIRAEDPRTSALLAVAAWRTSPTPEAVSALLSAQATPVFPGSGSPATALPPSDGYSEPVALSATAAACSRCLVPRTGPVVARGRSSGEVDLTDLRTKRVIYRIPGTEPIRSIAISPDARSVAIARSSNVELWDASADPVRRAALTGWAFNVAFSPDGRTLAATDQTRLRLWDVATAQVKGEAPVGGPGLHTPGAVAVWAVSFSPDGRLVAVASKGEVGLFNTSPALNQIVAFRHLLQAWDVTFSPDGRHLAVAGGQDKAVTVWDLADPSRTRLLSTFTGHTGAVISVAYGNNIVASGGGDNTVEVLNVSQPDRPVPIATLVGHIREVTTVVVTPDSRIISAGADGQVLIWDLDPNRVADLLCNEVGGNIDAAVWADKVPGISYRSACP